MSNRQNDAVRYGLTAAAVLGVGAAIYYLSRDPNPPIEVDAKVHSLEKLRAIVHEIFVESATLCCQKANQMRLAKIKKTWADAKLKDVKIQHAKDIEATEQIIFRENGITEEFFGRWLEAHSDDKEIREKFAKL